MGTATTRLMASMRKEIRYVAVVDTSKLDAFSPLLLGHDRSVGDIISSWRASGPAHLNA